MTLVTLCAGCVGMTAEFPFPTDIENPVPRHTPETATKTRDRWACQPVQPSELASKEAFLGAWGEPESKVVTGKSETWIYVEKGRECGLLGFAGVGFHGVQLPLMLPLCKTSDRVTFDGDVAVRSASWRKDSAGLVVAFHPQTGLFPWPFLIVPAEATAAQPGRVIFVYLPFLEDKRRTNCN